MSVPVALYYIVPTVLPLALFAWLGLVFWAAAHPEWKSHRAAPPREEPAARATGTPAVTGPPQHKQAA